jgi:hypothetical protein
MVQAQNPRRGDLFIETAHPSAHLFVFGTRAIKTVLHIMPFSRACRKQKE